MRQAAATTARILNQRMSRTMKATRYNTLAACIRRSGGNDIVYPRPLISPSTRTRRTSQPLPGGLNVLCGHTGAPGQFPAAPREVAGIAVRVTLQIVLVLGFRLPEFAGGPDLRHDASRPQTRGDDIVKCP